MQYLKAPVNVRADWTVYSSIGKPLADIYGSEDAARLIAAAPDLLAALAELVGALEADAMDDKSNVYRSMMLSANHAIARATGKA